MAEIGRALMDESEIDHLIARQLQRSIARNGRLVTALRRIRMLDDKNVAKYARQIANEALQEVTHG